MPPRFLSRYNEIDEQDIVEDYQEHAKTLSELAGEYEADAKTIRKILIKHGVTIRSQGRRATGRKPRNGKTQITKRLTDHMKNKGITEYDTYGLTHVAILWGCSTSAARKILIESGVKMHQCGWRAKSYGFTESNGI